MIFEIVDDVYLANAYAKNMYTILRYGFFWDWDSANSILRQPFFHGLKSLLMVQLSRWEERKRPLSAPIKSREKEKKKTTLISRSGSTST